MGRNSTVGKVVGLALSATLLSACAAAPDRPSDSSPPLLGTASQIETRSVRLDFSDVARRPEPQLWGVSLNSTEVLGVFQVGSSYDLVRGPWRASADPDAAQVLRGPLAGQRFGQTLNAALPLPVSSSNLEFEWTSTQESFWTDTGATTKRGVGTKRARWTPGRYSLEVNSTERANTSGLHCGFDARLRDERPRRSLGGSQVSLGGRRCERQLATGAEAAHFWGLEAAWSEERGFGLPGPITLRVGRVRPDLPRDALAARPASSPSAFQTGMEFSAKSSLALSGWTLSSAMATSNGGPGAWGSRTSLKRTVSGTPLILSMARHQPGLWSLDPVAVAGREASVGVDLSSPLRAFLRGDGVTGNFSYKRINYDVGALTDDHQFHLGVKMNW